MIRGMRLRVKAFCQFIDFSAPLAGPVQCQCHDRRATWREAPTARSRCDHKEKPYFSLAVKFYLPSFDPEIAIAVTGSQPNCPTPTKVSHVLNQTAKDQDKKKPRNTRTLGHPSALKDHAASFFPHVPRIPRFLPCVPIFVASVWSFS